MRTGASLVTWMSTAPTKMVSRPATAPEKMMRSNSLSEACFQMAR